MIVFSVLNRLVRYPEDQVASRPPAARVGRWRDPVLTRAEFESYRAAVRQDLTWLLNTRRCPEPVPSDLRELERSVYSYGLPDFSQMNLNPARSQMHQDRLAEIIRTTIELFEPRIIGVSVTAVLANNDGHDLNFRLSGRLRMDPHPEPVAYDTTLDVLSGEYAVKIPGEQDG
jgi:type VI secretion system protein ImpF